MSITTGQRQNIILAFLFVWLALWLGVKTDFSTADLGRHLKNGEMILSGTHDVFSKNFYSYTNTDYPVLNHHWGSGVIFFCVKKYFGFEGLGFFCLFLTLAAFFIFFNEAKRNDAFHEALLASVFFIPLIAERKQIRPEIFSYLLAAVFFHILWRHREGRLKSKWLFLLPVLACVWINLHIYFVVGLALVGIFYLDNPKSSRLLLILTLSIAASLINPFGWHGLAYPFLIFQNYGVRLSENLSFWQLEKMDLFYPSYLYLKWGWMLLAGTFAAVFIKRRQDFNRALFLLAIVVSALSYASVRHITLFALFATVIVALNLKTLKVLDAAFFRNRNPFIITVLCVLMLSAHIFSYRDYLKPFKENFGYGVREGSLKSGLFLKEHGLKGPIFNNFNSGGHLIYYLYPDEKVFVDNRPEAYPADFFQKVYMPALLDEGNWRALDEKYKFNTIYFSQELDHEIREFLIRRARDPAWQPVFADKYSIIFSKKGKD